MSTLLGRFGLALNCIRDTQGVASTVFRMLQYNSRP